MAAEIRSELSPLVTFFLHRPNQPRRIKFQDSGKFNKLYDINSPLAAL